MRTALFWVITQRVVVISYRRFGTTYRSQTSSNFTQDPVYGSIEMSWVPEACEIILRRHRKVIHAKDVLKHIELSLRSAKYRSPSSYGKE